MRVGVHDLFVEVQGDGVPVVFVHSSGLSGRQWRRWLPAFDDHRRIVPDLHGSGRNPAWAGPWPFRLSRDLDLVLALLEAHGPAHLVGHSYGGSLSLFACARRPDLVRSVAVYEPPLLGLLANGSDADRALLETSLPPSFLDPDVMGTPTWVAGFVDWWNGPGAFAALADAVRDELVRTGPKVAGEVLDLAQDPTPLSAFAVGCPILVMSGDRAPAPVVRALEQLATVPGVERRVLPGLGHMAPLVAPDALIPHVTAWIRGR
jgi:pimeloyl-ACP methyl ester carboxylesterase